jgi:hypothetical protein
MRYRAAPKKKPAPLDDAHPSMDTTRRCSHDARLRCLGFAIHARPKSGAVLWTRNGRIYPEAHALVIAQAIERGQVA